MPSDIGYANLSASTILPDLVNPPSEVLMHNVGIGTSSEPNTIRDGIDSIDRMMDKLNYETLQVDYMFRVFGKIYNHPQEIYG